MELIRFVRVLWRKKWLILTVVAIATVTAISVTFITPDIYKSSAQLATGITDNQDISLSQEQQAMTFFATQNKFSNLIENMNSRQVLSLLSYQLALHDLRGNTPFQDLTEFREKYASVDLSVYAASLQNKLDSIQVLSRLNEGGIPLMALLKDLNYDVATIEENLTITRIPSTDYVKIEYFSKNPLLSAFSVNTLSQEFIRYYLTARGERTNSSIQFLINLVQDKREELESRVNDLKNFKSSNEVVNLDMQSESIIQQITDLEKSREDERKKIIGYEQAIKKINEQLSRGDLSVLERQAQLINSRIVRLKDKINELNNRIIRSGSQDEALLNQLEQLRKELNEQILIAGEATSQNVNTGSSRQKLLTDRVNSEVELEIAKASLASINREISRLRNSVSGFASKEAEIKAYERDIEVSQDEYINAVNKLNEARLLSQNLGGSLRQVEFGYPADDPVQSRDILIVVISTAVSFFLTVITLVILTYVDLSPSNLVLFKRLTDLPTLGFLNKVPAKYTSPEHFFHPDLKDSAIDKFRELLRNIRHEIESTSSQVWLVSSLKPREGKTTFILSMALALSLKRNRILIIDTNFKSNSLTKIFSTKSLLERIPYGERSSFTQYPSGTGFKGIEVIGCEEGSATPEELFPKDTLASIISNLRTKYDYIFLEGPALNYFADTKELLSYADQLLLVTSAEKPINSHDQESLDFLKESPEKFLGAVLNKCNLEKI
ncbi:MAG: Wzz/FepE/Etk N-terminal domain-containing protein [Bacteroidota bacterium]